MEELLKFLFGNETIYAYIAAQIFGFLGFASAFLMSYFARNDKTTSWSFKIYWLENKRQTVVLVIMLVIGMFVGLRFQADIIDGVQSSRTYDFSFVKDKWFWFYIGGLGFRIIIYQGNKLYKKLTAKE